jgi:hypothetical protein
MTLDGFRDSLTAAQPPSDLSPALQALWYAAKGNWDKAHDITQPGGPDLDWVHAYLHRVEGDPANAGYWYRRAGRPVAQTTLDVEWEELVRYLLGKV